MSLFKVEVLPISKIWAHPNADRLELAQVSGLSFQFCIKKDEFKVGNRVVYFPVDSVLPAALADHLGVRNFLSGTSHDRVKTVKLRGQISQGLVSAPGVIQTYLNEVYPGYDDLEGLSQDREDLTDLTSALGVTKYEPLIHLVGNAKLIPLDVAAYDIEGADRFPEIVELLMDQEVVVTEKLEGMNFQLLLNRDGSYKVGQRNFYIQSNDPAAPHSFEAAASGPLTLAHYLMETLPGSPQTIRVRGEFLGPGSQGNYYGLKEHRIAVFEIEVDGRPMDARDVHDLLAGSPSRSYMAPELWVGKLRDYLQGRTIQEASNGLSLLAQGRLREGIVIRPFHEQQIEGFGRLIIKQRSPEYLASTDN